jgi:hypothetical protein
MAFVGVSRQTQDPEAVKELKNTRSARVLYRKLVIINNM